MNGAVKIVTHISYAKHEIDSVDKNETQTFHFALSVEHMIALIIQFETFREKKHAEIFRCSDDDIVVCWK